MRASRTTLLATLAGLAAFVASASGLAAQSLSLPYPYPANDTPLTLHSGIVVRVRNFVVFRGHNASSLTVVIQTPTPAADTTRVAAEALEVANVHRAFAQSSHADRIVVSVCRTQACLELWEEPAERFEFVPAAGGRWARAPRRPPR